MLFLRRLLGWRTLASHFKVERFSWVETSLLWGGSLGSLLLLITVRITVYLKLISRRIPGSSYFHATLLWRRSVSNRAMKHCRAVVVPVLKLIRGQAGEAWEVSPLFSEATVVVWRSSEVISLKIISRALLSNLINVAREFPADCNRSRLRDLESVLISLYIASNRGPKFFARI